MRNNNIAQEINQTIEDIWIILEKKERACTSLKLNNQQSVLLTLIIRHPFSTPSELAVQMGISKSAVSQQLAKLEKEDYIIRGRHAKDRRTFLIELDQKGLRYKNDMETFNQQIAEKYHANLSKSELISMAETLQKLRELLK